MEYIIIGVTLILVTIVVTIMMPYQGRGKLSIAEMTTRLRQLRKTYNNFSELERNTFTGRQVLKSITYLDKEIKKFSLSVGDDVL